MPNKRNTESNVFDRAFHTLAQKVPELVIAIINEIFGELFPLDTEVLYLSERLNSEKKEIIADLYVEICGKRYHIECQSFNDGKMIIRMFDYESQMVVEEAASSKNRDEGVVFPQGCIVYLRDFGQSIRNQELKVYAPEEQSMTLKYPALVLSDYGLEAIFKKDLYLLLPFYFLRYENNPAATTEECDSTVERALIALIKHDVKLMNSAFQDMLLLDHPFLTQTDIRGIMKTMRKVTNHIFRNNKKVKKEASKVMSNKLFRLPSDDLKDAKDKIAELEARHQADAQEIERLQALLKKHNITP